MTPWEGLPPHLLKLVFKECSLAVLSTGRLVCTRWFSILTPTVKVWRPGDLTFVSCINANGLPVEKLDLTQTGNAHNRHLRILGRLEQPSMSLAIGGSRKTLDDVCHLTNQALKWTTMLQSLTSLELHRMNQIMDKGMPYIFGMTHLKELHIIDCRRITEAPFPGISNLEGLESLTVSNCRKVAMDVLSCLQPLTALRRLNLTSPHIAGMSTRFCHPHAISRLEILELPMVRATVEDARVICQFPNLKALSFYVREDSSVRNLLPVFSEMTQLTCLDLAPVYSDFHYTSTMAERYFQRLRFSLKALKISLHQGALSADLESLSCLQQLTALQVCARSCPDRAYQTVSLLTQLRVLQILETNVPIELMKALMPLKQLEHLKLCGDSDPSLDQEDRPETQFSVLPLAISKLKALRSLDLSHTSLTLCQGLHMIFCMLADSGSLEELIAEDCCMSSLEILLLDRIFPTVTIKDYAEFELEGNTQIGRHNSVHF